MKIKSLLVSGLADFFYFSRRTRKDSLGAKERALAALDKKESTDLEGSSGSISGLDKYIRV
jgi:hypothetical protein